MPKLRVMETIRDERLGVALTLLQRSKPMQPGYMPLLAGCAFIGAAILLAYVFTQSPALSPTSRKPVAAAKPAASAGKADFELSGTPKEAVPVGSESAR